MLARWHLGAAIVALSALGIAEAAPLRSGRVVRVERPRVVSERPIRLCNIAGDDEPGMCWGAEPEPGTEGVWFDFQERIIGTVRVVSSRPHPDDPCGIGQQHEVEVDTEITGPGQPRGYASFAILNLELSDDARFSMMSATSRQSPSGDPDDRVLFGIARDGGEDMDALVSVRACDGSAPPPPAAVRGRVRSVHCLTFWLDDGEGWDAAQEEVLYECR